MSLNGSSYTKQQESIMETNNSSVVSKRSVEYLYFANEPSFYRYFVKKVKRRSPLINRGYWLRMKAIDSVVCEFVRQSTQNRKVIVNLGCGYDTLPWHCISRYQTTWEEVLFIDIDYKDLILRKRKIVLDENNLISALTNVEVLDEYVLLRSDQYLQLGCDLSKICQLNKVLSSVIDMETSSILFIAEVSITYMDVEASDKLIQWASNLPNAKFCLLEQILPDGLENPFAQTMIAHFDKLKSPLGAAKKYSSKISQIKRFVHLGWRVVKALSLWELWSSSNFLTAKERKALDTIEPFDEWEEFCLFGNHYFLLVASTEKHDHRDSKLLDISMVVNNELSNNLVLKEFNSPYRTPHCCKRYGAPLLVKSQDRSRDNVALFGGLGMKSRVNSRDEYSPSNQVISNENSRESTTPKSRMCHTITDLGDSGALLVGGRTSPDLGLSDCWIYHKFLDIWERVDELPWPLYRHQALRVGSNSVLVSIGRINSCLLSKSFLLWNRRTGWVECNYVKIVPCLVYGPVLFSFPVADQTVECGILAGGMSSEGVVMNYVWHWVLTGMLSEFPEIQFHESQLYPKLCRFGASTIIHHGKLYLFGGIVKDQILVYKDEICCFEIVEKVLKNAQVLRPSRLYPRYLFIGSSVITIGEVMIVIGGSAVCFSFGTFWNPGCLTLLPGGLKRHEEWKFLRTVEARYPDREIKSLNFEEPTIYSVPRIKLQSESHFTQVLNASKPTIFEGLNIGSCTSKWNTEYLKKTIGEDKQLIVHEASTEHMDFNTKNFKYISIKFGQFISQIEQGAKLYLRSLSSSNPSLIPADISSDFPSICSDFCLPPELAFVKKNFHSSPLRISGPVIMWLHYDTLANILCQIHGEKKIILLHPLDFKYLNLGPGKSSSSINLFENIKSHQHQNYTPRYEAILKPGDVVYIPPFWLHTLSPETKSSIGVNVFFKNFTTGYAVGKDVYGNRDLHAYEKGRQDIAKILATFDSVSSVAREFYLQRLIEEFKQKIYQSNV